jgi:gamma-glutamylcysteine synthetase
MPADFTEAEFREWLERRGVTGDVSPWEELPALEEVKARVLDQLHAAALARVTVTRLKLSRADWTAIAAHVGPLPTPEAMYSVCGVPVVMGDESR